MTLKQEFKKQKQQCKYYHLSQQKLGKKLKPYGKFEKVKDGQLVFWYPLSNTSPIFKASDVDESCFATTIEGALFGIYSDYDKPSKFNVYCTDKKPDVDLTDETVQDFGVIEEVRYRRPVDIKHICTISIPNRIIKQIHKCHYETEDGDVFFDDECGRKLKDNLRSWIKKETKCYDH